MFLSEFCGAFLQFPLLRRIESGAERERFPKSSHRWVVLFEKHKIPAAIDQHAGIAWQDLQNFITSSFSKDKVP